MTQDRDATVSESTPVFRALVVEAVKIAGTQSELARQIGCSQQQIYALCNTADKISAEHALGIHWATGGRVSGHKLRPDLWRRAKDVPTREESLRTHQVAS